MDFWKQLKLSMCVSPQLYQITANNRPSRCLYWCVKTVRLSKELGKTSSTTFSIS